MFATNINSTVSTGLSTDNSSIDSSNQQLSTDDVNRFAQLMSENSAGMQGNQPPPPPPPPPVSETSSDTETGDISTDSIQAQEGNRPPPPPPPPGSGETGNGTDLSNSEDLMSMISQLLSSLQSVDLSSLSDSGDSSSSLNGTFDDYFSQSYNNGSFS